MHQDDWQAQIRQEVERILQAGGRVSLLARDLRGGVTLLAREERRRVVSASTIKTVVMLALLEQVRLGRLSLADSIPLKPEEILEDTKVFDRGVGQYALGELMEWMIITSDNTASNALISLLGMDTVNRYARETLGMEETELQRKMLDWQAVQAGRNNYTSARDMERAFGALYRRSILTPELCRLAMGVLFRQRWKTDALRYVCGPVAAAHKTGSLDHLNHDTGILFFRHIDCFYGFFVTEIPNNDFGERAIGLLAKPLVEHCRGLQAPPERRMDV